MTRHPDVLARRALRIEQSSECPLYLFSLTAKEILQVADISRVARDQAGELIGYQRPEVRQHIQEIVDIPRQRRGRSSPTRSSWRLPSDSAVHAQPWTQGQRWLRGQWHHRDSPAAGDERKPGWIVDGQQRALALADGSTQDLPVPVNAFVATLSNSSATSSCESTTRSRCHAAWSPNCSRGHEPAPTASGAAPDAVGAVRLAQPRSGVAVLRLIRRAINARSRPTAVRSSPTRASSTCCRRA